MEAPPFETMGNYCALSEGHEQSAECPRPDDNLRYRVVFLPGRLHRTISDEPGFSKSNVGGLFNGDYQRLTICPRRRQGIRTTPPRYCCKCGKNARHSSAVRLGKSLWEGYTLFGSRGPRDEEHLLKLHYGVFSLSSTERRWFWREATVRAGSNVEQFSQYIHRRAHDLLR